MLCTKCFQNGNDRRIHARLLARVRPWPVPEQSGFWPSNDETAHISDQIDMCNACPRINDPVSMTGASSLIDFVWDPVSDTREIHLFLRAGATIRVRLLCRSTCLGMGILGREGA